VGSADLGRIKLYRVYFPQQKVQRGKAREPLDGAVPCCQSEYHGSGAGVPSELVGSGLLPKPFWLMHTRRRKPVGPNGSGITSEVAAGERAARNAMGSWALRLAGRQPGFLKRR